MTFLIFHNIYNKIKQNDMNKEFLHMQKLAGLITESEYKAKLNETEGNIADFLNQNMDEITSKLGDVFSNFETMGDPKVATAGDGEEGIDISFDKEHMLELFPEGDPYNKVESMDIAGKTVYYNDYR